MWIYFFLSKMNANAGYDQPIVKWYNTQAAMFADNVPRQGKCCAIDNNGSKRFAAVIYQNSDAFAEWFAATDRHMYEIIRNTAPARLFMDIDFEVGSAPEFVEVAPEKVVKDILDLVREYTFDHQDFHRAVVMRCVRPTQLNKVSFHITWPDTAFEAIDLDMKLFMIDFAQWVTEDKGRLDLAYQKRGALRYLGRFVADMFVYTKNRMLRGLGQSKDQDDSTLQIVPEMCVGQHRSSSDWIVQPRSFIEYSRTETLRGKIDAVTTIRTNRQRPGRKYPLEVLAYAAKYDSEKKEMRKLDTVASWMDTSEENVVVRRGEVTFKPRPICVAADVVIEKDEDLLEYLSAADLRAADFTSIFMPVLACLCHSVPKDVLANWACEGHTRKDMKKKYEAMIQKLRLSAEDTWITGNVAMQIVRSSLVAAKKGGETPRLIDYRSDIGVGRFADLEVIEPNPTTHEPLDAAQNELLDTLSKITWQDKKQRDNRRCFFITGKMGTSKSQAVRIMIEQWLRTGKIKSALYVCPRIILGEQTAEAVEKINHDQMMTREGRRRAVQRVKVYRYYTDGDDESVYAQSVDKMFGEERKFVAEGNFSTCVINSIAKTHVEHDVVIVDEPVVCTGNFFMDLVATESITPKDVEKCDEMIADLAKRIRHANTVFFIDAAFNRGIGQACEDLYAGHLRPVPGTDLARVLGKNNRATSVYMSKIRAKGEQFMTAAEGNKELELNDMVKVSEPRYLAVFNSDETIPAIFEHLIEYYQWEALVVDLVRNAYRKKEDGSRIKSIVYTSSIRVAKQLYMAINTSKPNVALITAEVVKQDGRPNTISKVRNSDIVIATPCLGIGSSWTDHHLFDDAFAFIEYHNAMPNVNDVVQQVARIRSITSRTLRYNVRLPECMAMQQGGVDKDLISTPDVTSFKETYSRTKARDRVIGSFLPLAKHITRRELMKGFAHTRTPDLQYKLPTYELEMKDGRSAMHLANVGQNECCKQKPTKVLRNSLAATSLVEDSRSKHTGTHIAWRKRASTEDSEMIDPKKARIDEEQDDYDGDDEADSDIEAGLV